MIKNSTFSPNKDSNSIMQFSIILHKHNLRISSPLKKRNATKVRHGGVKMVYQTEKKTCLSLLDSGISNLELPRKRDFSILGSYLSHCCLFLFEIGSAFHYFTIIIPYYKICVCFTTFPLLFAIWNVLSQYFSLKQQISDNPSIIMTGLFFSISIHYIYFYL